MDGLRGRWGAILQEVFDQGHGERGVLLHQPMAGAGDHGSAHIRRDVDDNVIFRDESGNATDAQLLAFEDTWR